jgi:hypothetical protein
VSQAEYDKLKRDYEQLLDDYNALKGGGAASPSPSGPVGRWEGPFLNISNADIEFFPNGTYTIHNFLFSGTYTVSGDMLYMSGDDAGEIWPVRYAVDGNKLTCTWVEYGQEGDSSTLTRK